MFPSISKAIPQTQSSSSFTATRSMVIVPVSVFTIKVNGQLPQNPLLVSVQAGQTVTAEITTPDDWLWHAFYHYTIDSVPCSFAVVNKSNYSISVKSEDAVKRWYIYEPQNHTASFQFAAGTIYPVNLGTNYEPIPTEYHVLLNPLDSSVYFYNNNGVQVSRVLMPADPIDYVKIPDRQSVVILVRGGEAYEIRLDNSTSGLSPFYARLNYSEFTDDNFVFQLPGEDLVTYLRRLRAKKTIPPATCITFDGQYLYVGGNGTVWIVDPYNNFNLIYQYDINEYVLNIAPLPNNAGAVLVTQTHRVYTMTIGGVITEIYQGITLWQPALFNDKIYIPESNVGLLKVYNPSTNSFESDIVLDEFSPSYITVSGDKMYVAGHDSERVLVFNSSMTVVEKQFNDKVTLVSAIADNILASHWMKSFKVLNLADLRRIVAVEFPSRRGPVSHVGTSVVTVKTLGNDEVYARTPPGTWLWINGQRAYTEDVRGALLTDNDIFSINLSCRVAGQHRTNCIIGDVVYDYDVEAVAQTYYPRRIQTPILPPGNSGIHSRTITLPNFFTACLMSIEYGVIKVNGALYYGNNPVLAGDIVTIEIDSKNKSVLPVFTIGLRQFVIPVSTNIDPTPVEFIETNVNPGVYVTQEFTFTEAQSLYDYIIPGYYDITIKKNNVDITGNYFQQFGVGDQLSVRFSSSPKLYDSSDVYILGQKNYRFTIQNELGQPIDYLDYGNVVYPYVRQLDPYAVTTTSSFVSDWYGNAIAYTLPDIQFYSSNITVSGILGVAGTHANISVLGSDAYFVLDGNITNDVNIKVYNGNLLAIARNVISYFDSNVTIVQHLPTGDEDGYADVTVGTWGLVNREIEPLTDYQDRNTAATVVGYDAIYNRDRSLTQKDHTINIDRVNQRAIFAANETLDPYTFYVNRSIELTLDSAISTSAPALVEELVSQTLAVPNEISRNRLQLNQWPLIRDVAADSRVDRTNLRTVFSADQQFDPVHLQLDPAPQIAQTVNNQISNAAYFLTFDIIQPIAVMGSTVEHNYVSKDLRYSIDPEFFRYNLRLAFESMNLRLLPADLLVYDLLVEFEHADKSLPAGVVNVDYLENKYSIIESSGVNYFQQEFWNNIATPTAQLVTLADLVSDPIPADKYSSDDFLGNLSTVLRSDINDTVSNVALVTNEKSADFAANAYLTQNLSATNFMANVFASVKSETIYYQNKDTEWFPTILNNSLIEPTPAQSAASSYQLINDTVSDKSIFTYFNWGQGKADHQSTKFSENKLAPPSINHWQSFDDLIVPDKLTLSKSITNLVTGNINNNLNYQMSLINFDKVIFSSFNSGQSFGLIDTNYSFNQTIGNITNNEYLSAGTDYDLYNPNNYSISQLFGEKNTITPGSTGVTNSQRTELTKSLMVSLDYGTVSSIILTVQDYTYLVAERSSESIDFIPMVLAQHVESFGRSNGYDRSESVNSSAADMSYTVTDIDYSLAKISYNRSPTVSDVYIKPNWSIDDYGTDLLAVYTLTKQEQNISAEVSMIFVDHRPDFYFTASRAVELDQFEIWDNDIDVPYGAFLSAEDAIQAAQAYTEFRPQLILDTNLWTYRVLFDTGLVCPLPTGRYPVAWLIRGG